MPRGLAITITLLSLGLLLFTSQKIYAMAQIRGWLAGGTKERVRVTSKWFKPPSTYWVAWGNQNIRVMSDSRINIQQELWLKIEVGNLIEIVKLGDSPTPYLKDGIYTSNGNFIFDFGLLLLEIVGISIGGFQWFKRKSFA